VTKKLLAAVISKKKQNDVNEKKNWVGILTYLILFNDSSEVEINSEEYKRKVYQKMSEAQRLRNH
jgi:hypothetical protein